MVHLLRGCLRVGRTRNRTVFQNKCPVRFCLSLVFSHSSSWSIYWTCLSKLSSMEVYTYKTGEIWKRAAGCSNVSMPVWVLYSSYIRCYYWGTLGEWYLGPLSIICFYFCESVIISKGKEKTQLQSLLQHSLA